MTVSRDISVAVWTYGINTLSIRVPLTAHGNLAYGLHMPPRPTCQPDGPEIKRRIFARGYSMAAFARKIGRPQSATTMRNICMVNADRASVEFIRQIAKGLSTPKHPVRPSDISDWTGDDDLYDDPPQPKALAS